jgi:acyl-CoA synthetase (AMP-forming)/AMP-acid ligase II
MAGSDQCVTYGALGTAARRGARLLREAGLRTGDGLVVLAENRVESLAVFWAAQLAGLYYTAISVQFLADEVNHILDDCDARAFVTTRAQVERLGDALKPPQALRFSLDDTTPGYASWSAALAATDDRLLDDASEGAEMLYSSGTTGRPKGVRNATPGAPLGTVSELFRRRVALHGLDAATVYLSTAPLYHSAPLRYNAMTHRLGGTSVVMEKFDAETSLALIERYRVTHSQWVPTMLVRLLRLPPEVRGRHDLGSHRYAIHAAAPCPVAVKRAMLEWWGPILHEYYSGTEGNGQTAISPEEWLAHPGSVGRAILGRIHIVGPDGRDAAPGATGVVYFEGGPAFEYYKDPEKTAASRTREGWSTLGDIGRLDADGYLYLTDRASHMIITGGVNVYPQEVENVLLGHPVVVDAAVYGVPDDEFGERVAAAVELVPGTAGGPALEAELVDWCRARLAHLKCPGRIEFHARLPRHETGKLYKRRIGEGKT